MVTRPSSDAGSSPTTTTNAAPPTSQQIRPPLLTVNAAKLREMLARAAKATPSSSSTTPMDFGRHFRKLIDSPPDSNAGALAIGKLLGLDPVGKAIEKLETADETLRARVAKLEANGTTSVSSRQSIPTPVTKSRRGRSNREAGLDCTGQMMTVLREDSRAAVFTGRMWEKRLKERFGKEEGFCRKTIEDQPLYKKQLRPAVVAATMSYGTTFEADFLEHGLELWSHKPGRGDKRKDHTEKQALAGRVFLAALENATIDAERRRGEGPTGGKHAGQ